MFSERTILSQPVRLHWAGWETDTYRLQQAGWSLSAEQRIEMNTMRLALRHEGCQVYGLTDDVPWHFMAENRGDMRGLMLPVRYMVNRLQAQFHQMGEFSFAPIDAYPQIRQQEIKSIEDFAHFATPLARTQEIIIPDESASDLLARILEMQQPGRTEYFKHQLREDRLGMRVDAIPRQKFHAQIVSIAA